MEAYAGADFRESSISVVPEEETVQSRVRSVSNLLQLLNNRLVNHSLDGSSRSKLFTAFFMLIVSLTRYSRSS